jgi:hypothetical protein
LPRKPRLEKVLDFARVLELRAREALEALGEIRPVLAKLASSEVEEYKVSIINRRKLVGGREREYKVLRVVPADGLPMDALLEVHVTSLAEKEVDRIWKLAEFNNAFASWLRATRRLLSALEEVSPLLSQPSSMGNGEVEVRG